MGSLRYPIYVASVPNTAGGGALANVSSIEMPAGNSRYAIIFRSKLTTAGLSNATPVGARTFRAKVVANGAFSQKGRNIFPESVPGVGGKVSCAIVRGRSATDGSAPTAITSTNENEFGFGGLTAGGSTAAGIITPYSDELIAVPEVIAPGEALVINSYMQAQINYVASWAWLETQHLLSQDELMELIYEVMKLTARN